MHKLNLEKTHPDWSSLIEPLADAQHAIWAHWMRWQFSTCTPNADGSLTIPPEKVERWQRQLATDYAALSESEKNSDREQARKVLAVLAARLTGGEYVRETE